MNSKTVKILAIDDIFDNLITLKALIIEAFPLAKVITATSGEEGLRLAISENPDVILLDIVMPDMDGFEVCKRLKNNNETSNIPVVFVTALKGDSETRIKALEVGAEAFIAKPIDQSELVAQIRAMAKIKLSQEQKLSENARLAALVTERTRELNENHKATLNLLEDLKYENEARRKTEEALRASEEKYRFMTENSSDIIWHLDANFVCDYISPSDERLRGFHHNEVIGACLWSILKPESIEKIKTANAARFIDKTNLLSTDSVRYELEQLCKDGSWIWTEANVSIHRNNKGEIIGYHGATRDISEQKRAQDALWESEEKYRTLVQYSSDPIFSYNHDDTYRFVNESFANAYGKKTDEIIGKTPHAIMSHAEADKRLTLIHTIFKTKQKGEKEVKVITSTGETHYYLTMADPIFDSEGEVAFVTCISKDITERKLAENALKAEKQKVETYLNIAQVILVAFDKEGSITLLNKKGYEVLGYESGELINKNWFEICVPQEESDGVKEVFNQIISEKSGTFNYHENQIITKTGERRTIAWNNTWVTDKKGDITGSLSSGEDITERKIAEEQLQHVGRLYALLSQINQAIVRTDDQRGLFQKICDVAVDFGQFTMAWVGMVDKTTNRVLPLCYSGNEEGYLDKIIITTTEGVTAEGIIGRSIQDDEIKISYDIANDPCMIPWREEALKRGYRSSIAVPFKCNDEVIGSLNFYSTEVGLFSEDEQLLLQEISEDISFALDARDAESKRIIAQKALIESETKYREFVENSPEAISIYADGKIVYVNKECIRLMRAKSKEELIGISVLEYIHPDNRETVLERMKSVAKSDIDGSLPLVEEKYIRMDGTAMFVEVKAMPIMLDGKMAVQLTARDISDRKKAEAALESSRKELKAIYDYAPVMMCVVDETGNLIFANNAFTTFTGTTRLKLKGDGPGDVFGCINSFDNPRGCGHGKACSKCVLKNAINSTFRTGKGLKNIEYESIFIVNNNNNNNQRLVSLLCSTALINNDGQKNLLLCLHDITDRKMAEENLLNSEARLESMFQHSPISIWEEDLSLLKAELTRLRIEGVTDFRKFLIDKPKKIKELISLIKVVGINETSNQIFGTESKAEVLENLDHFFDVNDTTIKVYSEEIIALAEGKTQFEGETQIITLDGEKKNLLMTLTIMPGFENTLSKALISFIDITLRKEAEEALQKSEMFLRTFIENTPFEIWARDINGIGILENKELIDHFGSILGQKPEYTTLDAPETLKLWEMNNSRAYTGELIDEIVHYNFKNESAVYQQIIFPIQDEKQIIGIAGFNINITERIRAEEELKRSENALNRQNELFTLLLKNLPVGVFMVEAPSGKPIMANDAAMRLLGREIAPDSIHHNLTGMFNAHKVGTTEYYPEEETPIFLGMKGISAHIDDMVVTHLDGTETLLEIFGSPVIDNQGNIWASLVSFTDITERKNAEVTLKNSQEQLKQFAAHLQNVREDERAGLAREIHDDLGQILVALKIDMGLLKNKVVKEFDGKMNPDIMVKFENLVGLVDNTIKTTRRIMTGLRPEVLEMLGFIEAAKLYAKDFEERHKIKCVFESSITTLDIAPQQSVALFRILQEALTNVVRHAKATQVTVQLLIENNRLIMEIVDNGIGFPKNHKVRNDSYGLIGMNERVFLLEGELIIEGKPGEGTIIRIEMPYIVSI